MTYNWENEALEKYGEEARKKLIAQQKRYESMNQGNDCEYCGVNNHGSIFEGKDGNHYIIHFGLWSNNRCNYCRREKS